MPGAALLAWAWLGQTPRAAALPGLALVVVGVAVVVLGGATRRTAAHAGRMPGAGRHEPAGGPVAVPQPDPPPPAPNPNG